MRLPRGNEVPLTAGVSGVVFVAALFTVGSPVAELVVFAAWGLVYLVECVTRSACRRLDQRRAGVDSG